MNLKVFLLTNTEKILITGAAGFIGSHTCEKMLQEGYQIIGIDNLNDYYDLELKKYNLNLLNKFPNFHFHKLDIRNFNQLQLLFKKQSFYKIIHLAAQAGVRYSSENHFIYQNVNVGGTLNLLELAHRFKCTNFIFTSSSSVYGNQQKVPFSEDDPLSRPVSIYAATKQAGEALCYPYHHFYGININCVRLFTAYGPRGRPDMAPHIFTSKVLKNQKVKLFDKSPSQLSRDFTFISDIVDGIVKTHEYEAGFQIFNLGYGEPIRTVEFLAILEELTGKTAQIDYVGRQLGDMEITYADISKAKKELGFQPKINPKKGLEIYLDWFLQYFRDF